MKILGILLEFKNKASKGIERVVKDTVVLDKVWKKGAKDLNKWTKSMGAWWDELKASTLKSLLEQQDGISGLSEALDKLENTFGERVGSIARSLATPTAALLGLGGVAVKAGIDFEKVMRKIRIEMDDTTMDVEKFGEATTDLAFKIGTGWEQTGKVMTMIASKMSLLGDDAKQMAESTLRAARVSEVEPELIMAGLIEQRRLFQLSGDELDAYLRGTVASAKVTRVEMEEMVRSSMSFNRLIGEMEERFQKGAPAAIMRVRAALSETFADAEPLIEKMVRGITRKMGPERFDLIKLMGRAGQNFSQELIQAFNTGDIDKSFEVLMRGIQEIPLDKMKQLAPVFEELTGMSMSQLDRLHKFQMGTIDEVADAWRAAAADKEYLVDLDKKTLNLTRRLWQVWERIGVILAPVGMAFVEMGHAMVSALEPIMGFVNLIMSTQILGKIVGWGVALAVVSVTLGAILFTLKVLIGIAAVLAATVAPLVIPFLLVGAAVAAVGALLWVAWQALKAIWTVISPIAGYIVSLGALIGSLLLLPIIELGKLIWKHLGVGLVSALGAIFNGLWAAIKGIGNVIYTYIIKPVSDFFSWLGDKLDGLSSFLNTMTGGVWDIILGTEEDKPKGLASGGMVMPSPGGSIVNVAEGGQPEIIADPNTMRKIIGSDDIIDAIYASTNMLIEFLGEGSTAPGAESPLAAPNFSPLTYATPRSKER